MSNTDLATTERGRSDVRESPNARTGVAQSSQRPAQPAADIFEDAGGITLYADMPGVSHEKLDVRLDGDSLAIEGEASIAVPEGMRPLWAEVNVPRFRRAFAFSRDLDASRIEAHLKDGVLSLRIPKHADARPRRIAVQAG
jgi:HSP20 family molecular chaperone IbpA